MWLQEKVIKSDNHYLTAQITSFIVLCVCSVIGSVLGRQLIFRLDFPTTRVILSRKRGRAVWLTDNAYDHPLSSLKICFNKYPLKLKNFSNKERDTGKPIVDL